MNIYQKTYLDLINENNNINQLTYLLKQNNISKKNLKRIKTILFKNIIKQDISEFKQQEVPLKQLIDFMSSLPINKLDTKISNNTIFKIKNIINNAIYENSLKKIFINKLVKDGNNYNIAYIQNLINKNISSLSALQSNDKYQKINKYIIKLFNEKKLIKKYKNISEAQLLKIVLNLVLAYYTKKNNNISNKILIKIDNQILTILLSYLDEKCLNAFLNYQNKLYKLQINNPNLYQKVYNKLVKTYTNNDFSGQNNIFPIFNPQVLTKFINIVYNIKVSTSANAGKGELLLSCLFPFMVKPTDACDLIINNEKAQVKDLNNTSGAKLLGQTNGKPSYEKNVKFISTFINTLINKLPSNLKNTEQYTILMQLSKKKNISNFRIKQNIDQNQGFIKVLNLIRSLDPTIITKQNIIQSFQNAFIEKYNNIINIFDISNKILQVSQLLTNTIDLTNNKVSFKNPVQISNIWGNYFGIIELIAYIARQKSKYFICCNNISSFKTTIFNCELLCNITDINSLINLFKTEGYIFKICDFADTGQSCACSIKLNLKNK